MRKDEDLTIHAEQDYGHNEQSVRTGIVLQASIVNQQ